MNKLFTLLCLLICFSQNGWSQQMDALSIHHGNFRSWSPSPGGGIRVAGRAPANLNDSIYPVNYSKQNGYVGRLKRNGSLDFLHLTMSEGYVHNAICTENSVLQHGALFMYDSFTTEKYKFRYSKDKMDASDYLALFKGSSKPYKFEIAESSYRYTKDYFGEVSLDYPILDANDDIYYSLGFWGRFYSSTAKRAAVSFGGSWHVIDRSLSKYSTSYIGLIKKSGRYNKALEVHCNKGGVASVWKGINGSAYLYGSCYDSVYVRKGWYRDSFKFPENSKFIFELDTNWKVINSITVQGGWKSINLITADNSQLFFQIGTHDSVKVGDTTLYRTPFEHSWLVRLKQGSQVDVVSSFAHISHLSRGLFQPAAEIKDCYAIAGYSHNDSIAVKGKNYLMPAPSGPSLNSSRIGLFFDRQHNLVNVIPGALRVKFGSNGNLYFERNLKFSHYGPKMPDSIQNRFDSGEVVVTEISKKFIYSNLITPGFSYCPGDRIKVIPMSIEKFDSNNVFTMELSDSNGHFINPTVIGSLKSSVLDTVTGVVPNALGSKHYRVRLVSSSPKHIGLDNAFDVEVKEPAARPNASDVYYCQGETAAQLGPSGNGVKWYTKPSDTTGGGLTTPPTPSTTSAGITTYLVTQPDAICGISARLVDVHVRAPKGLSAFSDTYYCKDDSAVMLSPMGKNLRWYTNPADTVNKGLSTPPTPLTTTVGTQIYLITQYDSVCGDSSAEVKVHVQAPYQLPNTVDRNYCVGDTAMALSPSGNGLIWYMNPSDTSGKGTSVPPTPSTLIPGLQTYLISTQHDTVCPVSTKLVKVNVQAPLDTPVITQKDTLLISSLSSNIKWYKNSTAISGATDDTLVHSGNGLYKVVYTDSNGCQSFDTVAIKSVAVQTAVTSQLQAYPNPFGHQILVDVEGLRNVRLFNANGQLVMQSRDRMLNTSYILPGLYHLEVSTQSGEVHRKKMVKY